MGSEFSAAAHNALRIRNFLAEKSIKKWAHPLYSPEFALTLWFFSISVIENALKGPTFANIPDVRQHVATSSKAIPEN